MLESLLRWFRPREEKILINEIDLTKPCVYPLGILEKYVGQTIEVNYLNQGQNVIAKDRLKCKPNADFFYLEFHIKDGLTETVYEGYSQILWNRTDTHGREFKVLSIKDTDGNVIYDTNPKEHIDAQRLSYIDGLRNLREQWTDEIPAEIIHDKGTYKARIAWFEILSSTIQLGFRYGYLDDSFKPVTDEFYKKIDGLEKRLTTKEDIEAGNEVLLNLISKLENPN